MGRVVRFGIVPFAVVCLLAGCATMPKRPEALGGGDYAYAKKYLSWLIGQEMRQHEVAGLSIALVDDQKVVWAEGFGFADEDGNVAATPETVYRVGSISKLFTATAALQLAEQGKLDLDRPLKNYLPDFSIKSRFRDAGAVTPRNIMTHHSGLPSDLLKGMWTRKPVPFETNVDLLRQEYAANPPNYVFSYSNLGVTLLGHALQTVAGNGFASHLDATLLQPLGMTHSRFSVGPDRSTQGAKAYRKRGDEAEELPLRDLPAGGLNSTVHDLSRFISMVFADGRIGGRRILKAESVAEMLRPQNRNVPLDFDFRIGLGWMLGGLGPLNPKAGVPAHHGGATLYHRSQLVVLPEHKLGVVVLSNSATAGGVVLKVATEAIKIALESKTGLKSAEPAKPSRSEATLSRQALEEYPGWYATPVGVVEVTRSSDHLEAELMQRTLRLVPQAEGRVGLQYRLLGLFPIGLGELDRLSFSVASVAGRDVLKLHREGEDQLVGERLQPGRWTEAAAARVGSYEVINRGDDAVLFDDVQVRMEKGLLLVEYALPIFSDARLTVALVPVSDTEAVTAGLGRSMGETIRVVKTGGEELLRYSGYLLRKKRE